MNNPITPYMINHLRTKEGIAEFREITEKNNLIVPRSGTEISRQALTNAINKFISKKMQAGKWLVYWDKLTSAK